MSPDFVVGNLKHSCVGSEQTKEVFLGGGGGGGVKVFFGLPIDYSSLLPISQNN